MPDKIDGKKLTARQHRQWRKVKARSGSAAVATAAVKKTIKARKEGRRHKE